MEKIDVYAGYINKNILPYIDYSRLQESYGMEDKTYAKGVLNLLHEAMIYVYGTDRLEQAGYGYVLVPGVLQGKETGNICLALLEMDIESSGELYEVCLLTEYGLAACNDPKLPIEVRGSLVKRYGEFAYGYTALIPGDIHIDKDGALPGIQDMLSTYKKYEVELDRPDRKTEMEGVGR